MSLKSSRSLRAVSILCVLWFLQEGQHLDAVRSRPCDPNLANFPPDPGLPRWRPGSYPGCLGGTDDAAPGGHCEKVWCSGILRITPDPVEAYVGQDVTVAVFVEGRMDLAGNATTPNGSAELDWGDGERQALDRFALRPSNVYHHVYKKAGQFFPSARTTQDFKYDGHGSCSYRCDLRRAAIITVYPALVAPHLHTVAPGESLFSIGQKYGVNNWLDIYVANKKTIAFSDLIYPGQVLLIAQNVSTNTRSSFWGTLQGAWDRIRGAASLSEREHPLEDGAGAAAEYFNDKQMERQIEAGRQGLRAAIESKLKSGSPGVVVRIAVYTKGDTKIPSVELWGVGGTPLIGIGDGLASQALGAPPPSGSVLDANESYYSFYSIQNGNLMHEDLPNGVLISGDANEIRSMAENAKRQYQLGKAIAEQMKAAQGKAELEKSLRMDAELAKQTASQRQSADEGPLSKPQMARSSPAPTGHSGGPDKPDVRNGSGIPNGQSRPEGSSNAGHPSGSPSPRNGSGLPYGQQQGIPIGGEHPGQLGNGRPDPGNGVPIGTPDHPTIPADRPISKE